MKKEQLIKEFSELYVGKNPIRITEEYVKKKNKEMILLVIACLFLVSICFVKDKKSSILENNILYRNVSESGKKEIDLQIKREDGVWEDVFLELHSKQYSKEELEQLFLEACKELSKRILNGNESLDYIHSDLNLVQELESYPFWIEWESSNLQIVDEKGRIVPSFEEIDEEIEITAILQYGDWKKEYKMLVHVIIQPIENFIASLEKELKEQEQITRGKEEFELPSNFQKTEIQWRYLPGNSALVMGIFLAVMLTVISYEKDKEICNKTKQRREELQEDFPEFISKLILLMEAGMSIRGAIFQIANEEQKRRKAEKKNGYLYMELMYICQQMKNGLSEKAAYELLGKRCNLSSYKKLSGLLVQHLQKGGSNILETLRNESRKVGDERRRQIQKKGEEMETKLLFPMMIMLGIVMIFIMVPALFSFQV